MRAESILQRRTFLAALGLGIGGTLATRMARRAAADPGDGIARLFIFYLPHGWPIEFVEPLGAGGDLSASTILSPLSPYASSVSVVRGISMNDEADNHVAVRAVLTGFSEGGDVDSIDASIASGLGVTPHVIGAMPYDPIAGFTQDAFLVKHGAWVRANEDPLAVADALFDGLGTGTPPPDEPPDEPNDDAVFRNQTLELTERELEQLHDAVTGLTSEQTKLSLHLEAIRHLKANGGGGTPEFLTCDERPLLPAVEAMQGLDPMDQANFAKVLDAQLQAAAYAMVCGSAQVITMQNMWVNSNLDMGFPDGPGISKGHHEPISHSSDAAGRAEFASCQRWFFERMAQTMLSVLDQPDPADTDPERTVLDNSLIYVCSEVADGFNHNSYAADIWIEGQTHYSSLPAVLIGGAGGYLRPGGVVDVERNHLDLLATLSDAMGVPVAQIGGQSVSVIEELQA